MVPEVALPAQFSGVESFWAGHPFNPTNRPGHDAATNPYPEVQLHTPGRDYDENTINPAVDGTVIYLPSGGNINSAIAGAADTTNLESDPLGRKGNVTVVLEAGGTYNAFDLRGYFNIAIICPDAQYHPGDDGIPGTSDANEIDTRPRLNGTSYIFPVDPPASALMAHISRYYFWADAALDGSAYDMDGNNKVDWNGDGELTDLRSVPQDEQDLMWTAFRHPIKQFYFKNIKFEGGGALHCLEIRRTQNILFDTVSFKSRYPNESEKHHRGSLMGNMGISNMSFLNCQFMGDSEHAFYFDGAHMTVINNCYVKLDRDSTNPSGSNSGFLFLCNDDFTEPETYGETNIIDHEEELNAKFACIVDNFFDTTVEADSLCTYVGEGLLVQDNICNGNLFQLVKWDSRTLSDRSATFPDFHYDYNNVVIKGNSMGNVLHDGFLDIYHIGADSTWEGHDNDQMSYMGGYFIGDDNTVNLNGKPWVFKKFPGDSAAWWVEDINHQVWSPDMPDEPPLTPTALVASATGETTAALSWTDNSHPDNLNEFTYEVERSTDGSNWSVVVVLPQDSTSHTDTGLNPATTYHYRVRGTSILGESGYSNIDNTTTSVATPPAPPTGLTVTEAQYNKVILAWLDNATNETGYRVDRSPAGLNDWTQVGMAPAESDTFEDTGAVQFGTAYDYRVRAFNSVFNSIWSNTVSATTPTHYPNQIGNSGFEQGTSGNPNKAVLWQHRDYITRVSEDSQSDSYSRKIGPYQGTANYSNSDSGGRVSDIKLNTTYTLSAWFKAVGVQGNGVRVYLHGVSGASTGYVNNTTDGGWQQFTAEFTTGSTPPVAPLRILTDMTDGVVYIDDVELFEHIDVSGLPATPTNLSATAFSHEQIDLSWTDNADNEDGYKVERSPGGQDSWTQIASLPAGSTSHQDSGLQEQTTYDYRVRAYNAQFHSSYSAVASATTSSQVIVNQVSNGGFELGDGVEATNWQSRSFMMRTTEEVHSGSYSRKVLPDQTSANYSNSDDFGTLKTETTYILSAWFKGSDVVGSGVKVYFHGINDADTGRVGNTNGEWVQLTAEFTTGASLPGIPLRINVNMSEGVVYVDDIVLREKEPVLPPENLAVDSVTASSVSLSWSAPSGMTGITGYHLYRDGSLVASPTGESYTDAGLVPETSYDYTVTALKDGNESMATGPVTATTSAQVIINQVSNGGFELGDGVEATNWQSRSFMMRTTEEVHSGSYSRKVLPDQTSANYSNSDDFGTLKTETTYILSAWFKGSDVVGSGVKVYFHGINDADTGRVGNTNGEWVQLTAEFTTGASLPGIPLRINVNMSEGVVYVDDIVLREKEPVLPPENLAATAISYAQIDLLWTDNADNEDGYKVERSPGGQDSWTQIASLPAGSTSHQDSGLQEQTTYDYRVRAYNAQYHSSYSAIASATTDPIGPWQAGDIGAVNYAGSTVYDAGADKFTLEGAGADIWNTVDAFHYTYVQAGTSYELIAKVEYLENTNQWAKAGLMARDSLNADAANVFLCVTPSNGIRLQRRTTDGAATTDAFVTEPAAPVWLKLVRNGADFTGFYSADGQNWTPVGGVVTMANIRDNAYTGLAVTSHNVQQLATAEFSSVTLNGAPFTGGQQQALAAPAPITALPSVTSLEELVPSADALVLEKSTPVKADESVASGVDHSGSTAAGTVPVAAGSQVTFRVTGLNISGEAVFEDISTRTIPDDGVSSDIDADGVDDFLVYALGAVSDAFADDYLPELDIASDDLVFTVRAGIPAPEALNYTVDYSVDEVTWSPVPAQRIVATGIGDGVVEVRVIRSYADADYLRLNVTKP